jgi:glyoxylase-like metal-dependent hydrolase (beta-lactamase superfamily II)
MRIHSIETGFFSTDGGAMFGVVPRTSWTRIYPFEEDNRCPLTMRVVYAEIGKHKVLFDTGIGALPLDELASYHFRDVKKISEELEKMGIPPSELTDVVLSHLHFDHCGGSVVCDAFGKLIPAFPNATYWASKRQCELSKKPSAWESDSYAPNVVAILEEAGLLKLIDEDCGLFPGLEIQLYQGHTQGQLVSWISSLDGASYVIPGDVMPMTPHISPLCISAFDCSAEVSVLEKMRFLEKALNNQSVVFLYHDVENQFVTLVENNGCISF